jgi:hypothetical protein
MSTMGRDNDTNVVKLKGPNKPSWRDHVFTAAQLRTMEFPPVSYVVPGLIPEGLTILAGRPKIGKSWMVLDIAIGVATEGKVLGNIHVVQGDVLYCALEDNPRRLQRRMRKLGAQQWPSRLTFAHQWRRLDDGGVEDIKEWCDGVDSPRLVLLDTLAGVRPERVGKDTPYDGDYKALQDIHRFANEKAIGVAVLHHTRKMEADDPLDSISGTLGQVGCADTGLILSRTSKGTTLYVRGRDIEESERAMEFMPGTCRWKILGDAAEVHRSNNKKAIIGVLMTATELMTPAQISADTTIPRATVDVLLGRMVSEAEVIRVVHGKYRLPGKEFSDRGGRR